MSEWITQMWNGHICLLRPEWVIPSEQLKPSWLQRYHLVPEGFQHQDHQQITHYRNGSADRELHDDSPQRLFFLIQSSTCIAVVDFLSFGSGSASSERFVEQGFN